MLDPYRQVPCRPLQKPWVTHNVALIALSNHLVFSALRLFFQPPHRHTQVEVPGHWPLSAPRWPLHTSPSSDRSPRSQCEPQRPLSPYLLSSEIVQSPDRIDARTRTK